MTAAHLSSHVLARAQGEGDSGEENSEDEGVDEGTADEQDSERWRGGGGALKTLQRVCTQQQMSQLHVGGLHLLPLQESCVAPKPPP